MTAPFLAGSRLGPYEIIDALGAGGMGEVYRARDTRLRREVAIKVLPMAFGSEPEFLKRFEREARAVGQLNHPNIVAIYDVGHEQSVHYVVMELLEGETLGKRLQNGPLPPRKTLEVAMQIAHGLAAAHEKHIVHRDLKPENVFLTRNNRVKILDFGLARQLSTTSNHQISARLTEPGMVVGTPAFMSPEQVRGLPLDHRSDIFSFGVVLYEMLTGQNPYEGDSPIETMNAILKVEPRDAGELVPNLPPILRRVVTHCLEKDPEARFQSANDLIFDLENCSQIATGSSLPAPAAPPRKRFGRTALILAALVLLVAAAGGVTWLRNAQRNPNPPPAFKRMTFRRGIIQSARFTKDGSTVIYAASWDGEPLRLYLARTDSPDSQTLPLPNANLLSISHNGEMAIALNENVFDWFAGGTLAEVPLLGGSPREMMEGVIHADWSSDGRLAVWRRTKKGTQLEFPIGTPVFTTDRQVALGLRVSPKGDQIAVHLIGNGLTGEVATIGLDGKKRTLAGNVVSAPGLAWTADGKEVWFAATPAGDHSAAPAIFAVTLDGEQRLVTRMPGWLWLHDISRDGTLLMTYNVWQSGILLPASNGQKDRDLSWLDWSVLADVSPDGRSVLFTEAREGVANTATVYLRTTDDSPAVRLGEGVALDFSPHGDWVLALQSIGTQRRLILLPTRAGETETVRNGLDAMWGGWLPDGRLILSAQTPQGPRMFVQARGATAAQPITPPGLWIGQVDPEGGGGGMRPVSPDGKLVLVFDMSGRAFLQPIGGGTPREISSVRPGDYPAGWSVDSRHLYVYQPHEVPIAVQEIDIAANTRTPLQQITVSDLAGIYRIGPLILMPDGRSFAHGYVRTTSTLYTAKGLR